MRNQLIILCIIGASVACQAERAKVKFDCTCDDQVGALYATALRDSLATSPRFIETAKESEPKSEGSKELIYHFVISVVSVDIDTPAMGHQSALSVVFTIGGVLIGQRVQVCGAQGVSQCAAETLAGFDSTIHSTFH